MASSSRFLVGELGPAGAVIDGDRVLALLHHLAQYGLFLVLADLLAGAAGFDLAVFHGGADQAQGREPAFFAALHGLLHQGRQLLAHGFLQAGLSPKRATRD